MNAKPVGSRLGLAVQPKFFAAFAYFATSTAEVPGKAVSYLTDRLALARPILTVTIFQGARDVAIARKYCVIWVVGASRSGRPAGGFPCFGGWRVRARARPYGHPGRLQRVHGTGVSPISIET
ncbi:hypothetical protein MPL3356_270053 [Mesorhizobium plurifarium]|uniref:Uncharacterized protein n=1 Tax=Mesorhizobium plurifarium TaxID=69974 RepID=A0A090FH69_MESPL|nr:hypothetical protein MPL3356_270053 [Mesorhizobium plurifarium]CDX20921.1 hypothetical protein MPLB_1990004 [Mesorhizobium sp. ORS 3324]CDX45131.1 hypothetical protein MPLA_750108 [Mesorhizobium sp. ORS 3359]